LGVMRTVSVSLRTLGRMLQKKAYSMTSLLGEFCYG
jgi:hypothetical protein